MFVFKCMSTVWRTKLTVMNTRNVEQCIRRTYAQQFLWGNNFPFFCYIFAVSAPLLVWAVFSTPVGLSSVQHPCWLEQCSAPLLTWAVSLRTLQSTPDRQSPVYSQLHPHPHSPAARGSCGKRQIVCSLPCGDDPAPSRTTSVVFTDACSDSIRRTPLTIPPAVDNASSTGGGTLSERPHRRADRHFMSFHRPLLLPIVDSGVEDFNQRWS